MNDDYVDPGVCRIIYGGETMGIVLLGSDMAIWGLRHALTARRDIEFWTFPGMRAEITGETRQIWIRFKLDRIPGIFRNSQIGETIHNVARDPAAFLQYVFGAYFGIDDDPEGYRLVPLFEKIADIEFGEGAEP